MTKEQAIEEVNKAFEPAFANYIITALTEGATVSDKALEQQPTTQEILSHIETGITATGQSDSYCVGFCNALVWLKSCITHEEPQFFEDKGDLK